MIVLTSLEHGKMTWLGVVGHFIKLDFIIEELFIIIIIIICGGGGGYRFYEGCW
jgi:hypothetical protein